MRVNNKERFLIMSFPFDIKEELVFPIDFCVQAPEQDGVKVLKRCWVQAKNINYKHKNLGRALGKRKEAHVFTFKKIFNGTSNIKYDPFHNDPVIIEENGDLVCGRHRVEGALLANPEAWIWVFICEFANTKVRKQYAIKENINTQKPNLPFDEDDIIDNIHAACTDGDCNKNATAIKNYLNEIAPDVEGKGKIVDEVLKLVDVTYDPQDPPTRTEIEDYLTNELCVNPNEMKSSWKIVTLRAGKGEVAGDRKARFLKTIRPILVNGQDINAVITFSDTRDDLLNQARATTKNEFIPNWIEECCEVADAFREGTLGKVYYNFPKQTKSEFEDDNFFVEVK